jgi:hypothetical protein
VTKKIRRRALKYRHRKQTKIREQKNIDITISARKGNLTALDNDNGLVHTIERTFCELMDFKHYHSIADTLSEQYDETLEHHQFPQWLFGEKSGTPYERVYQAITELESALYDICRAKEDELCCAVELAIVLPKKETLHHLFGANSDSIDDADSFLKSLKQYLDIIEEHYTYNIEDQIKKLKEIMNLALQEYLGQNRG